jgi:hypothetical protein
MAKRKGPPSSSYLPEPKRTASLVADRGEENPSEGAEDVEEDSAPQSQDGDASGEEEEEKEVPFPLTQVQDLKLGGYTFEQLKHAENGLYLMELNEIDEDSEVTSVLVDIPAAIKSESMNRDIFQFLCTNEGKSDPESRSRTAIGWISDVVNGTQRRYPFMRKVKDVSLPISSELGKDKVIARHNHRGYL